MLLTLTHFLRCFPFFFPLLQVYAWQVADQLLCMNHSLESCYFAAQTMRTKVTNKTNVISNVSKVTHFTLIFKVMWLDGVATGLWVKRLQV